VGSSAGFSPALLMSFGAFVKLTDLELNDEWAQWQNKQMMLAASVYGRSYVFTQEDVGEMQDERAFDVVACVSTLEHIAGEERAFRNMCRAIKPDGLLFLTMDSAYQEEDIFQLSHLRAGRIYAPESMGRLVDHADSFGLRVMGGETDWRWKGAMVNDHSFSSLVMTRNGQSARRYRCGTTSQATQ
jgi:SAM-dependent methyltransferase